MDHTSVLFKIEIKLILSSNYKDNKPPMVNYTEIDLICGLRITSQFDKDNLL